MTESSWLLKDVLRRWGEELFHPPPAGYPAELEGELRTRDGVTLEVRPVRPDDVERLKAALGRLSPESRYQRFHGHVDALSDEAWRYLTHLDYQHHLALVALDEDQAVGVARYYLPEGEELAEAAVVVLDAWQHRGVGGGLLRRLAQAAEARGVKGFQAFIRRDNALMLRVVERSGFRLHVRDADEQTLQVQFRFDELI